jgi:hypothetical protein
MLYAVPIGIAAGLALGGRLALLGEARLRHVPVFVLALIIQVALFSTPLGETTWALAYGPALYVGSLALVMLGLLANRGGVGAYMVLLGACSNLAVIAANGGRMPVLPQALLALKGEGRLQALSSGQYLTNVAPMEPETGLWFLGDIFAMPGFVPFANVFSVGDVVAGLGVAFWLAELMQPRRVAVH